MNVLHILASGGFGGIEVLCKEFTKYSAHKNHVMFFWGEGSLAQEMQNNDIRTLNIHAESKNFFSVIHSVLKYCKENQIQAVIVHHAAPLAHICLMVIKWLRPKIKTIAYAHGNAVDMYRKSDIKGANVRKFVLTFSLKKADSVIAISQSVKDSLEEFFSTPKEKIRLIYNGVDMSRFGGDSLERPLDLDSDFVQMIYVGRLVKDKGVQTIIQAIHLLPQKYHLMIAGDGPYREELEELAVGVKDRIEFLGNRKDIPDLLKKADLFVHMPQCEEGFGITVVEAMAAGKVCIVADKGAMREVIHDGIDGFVVENANAEKLAEFILNLSKNCDIEKIRTNAFENSKMYGIEKYVQNVDDLINHI